MAAHISDYDDRELDGSATGDDAKPIDCTTDPGPDRYPDLDLATSVAGDSVAGHIPSAATNPRKRKKSSRACDFCHVNHQPCDNAQPRCSYCERHDKPCLYLRPQKKRGPAQGYRSALHTLRESAAAWGAALNLIPSLGPVVENYLKQPEGARLIKAIKDPAQQEFFIQAWQQSGVFKTFFPEDAAASGPGDEPKAVPDVAAHTSSVPNASSLSLPPYPLNMGSQPSLLPPASGAALSPPHPPVPHASHSVHLHGLAMSDPNAHNPFDFGPPPPRPPASQDGGGSSMSGQASRSSRKRDRQVSMSLSDIQARDAARPSLGFSQTLGPLGFAPNETLEDFLNITFNPEPIEAPRVDQGPVLSNDQERAYYELLMGRRFD